MKERKLRYICECEGKNDRSRIVIGGGEHSSDEVENRGVRGVKRILEDLVVRNSIEHCVVGHGNGGEVLDRPPGNADVADASESGAVEVAAHHITPAEETKVQVIGPVVPRRSSEVLRLRGAGHVVGQYVLMV